MKRNYLGKIIQQDREYSEATFNVTRYFAKTEAETNWEAKDLESALYRKFVDIATKSRFFSLEHIDALGVDYDILIFVSEKNVGKTYAIYDKIRDAISKGEKSVVLRIMAKEVDAAMHHFNNDSRCPVYAAKKESSWFFFDKEQYLKTLELETEIDNREIIKVKFSKALDMGLTVWGFATSFKTANTIAGGTFEGYKYIFIDEFITWSNQKVFTKQTIENWTAFPSSIARNKQGLKIFMFGNFKDSNTEILDYYGIERTNKLRYIRRGFVMCSKCRNKFGYVWNEECSECSECQPPCKIFYINADSLYKGVAKQTAIVRHASPEERASTLSNRATDPSDMVISPDIYYRFVDPQYIALYLDNDYWLIEIKKGELEPGVSVWAVKVNPLKGHHVFYSDPGEKIKIPIKTDEFTTYNRFRNVVKVPSLKPLYKDLFIKYRDKRLFFYSAKSLQIIEWLLCNIVSSWHKFI